MKKLDLTRVPDFVDDLGRPCYRVAQERGLRHDMSDDLLRAPTAAGYSQAADEAIFSAVAAEVRRAGTAGPVDVLEIGGGTGQFFDRVRDLTRSYINVEPGDAPADPGIAARLADPRYAAIGCTAADIPIRAGTADLAIAIASLDHLPDPRAALAEIARCLRPRGTIVLSLNNAGSWWKRALRSTARLRAREDRISVDHYFQWSVAECALELGLLFADVRARTLRYVPYIPHVWRVVLPVADVLGPVFLPGLGGDIIATARRRDSTLSQPARVR